MYWRTEGYGRCSAQRFAITEASHELASLWSSETFATTECRRFHLLNRLFASFSFVFILLTQDAQSTAQLLSGPFRRCVFWHKILLLYGCHWMQIPNRTHFHSRSLLPRCERNREFYGYSCTPPPITIEGPCEYRTLRRSTRICVKQKKAAHKARCHAENV